jgi:hypothetical protein
MRKNVDGMVDFLACPSSRRPRLSALMPLIEPLPPPQWAKLVSPHFVDQQQSLAPTAPSTGWEQVYRGPDGRLECLASDGSDCTVDVPAISHTAKVKRRANCNSCSTDELGAPVFCTSMACGIEEVDDVTWTCADKARVLLTAEDGTRHCIKF